MPAYAKSRLRSRRILAWISKLLKQITPCCQHNNVNKMTLHFLATPPSPPPPPFPLPRRRSTLSKSATRLLQSARQLPQNKWKWMKMQMELRLDPPKFPVAGTSVAVRSIRQATLLRSDTDRLCLFLLWTKS